jgi:hypothetical protein
LSGVKTTQPQQRAQQMVVNALGRWVMMLVL